MTPLRDQRVLVIVPSHNSPGKKDVTGAFRPEAQSLVKLAAPGSRWLQFDNRLSMIGRRDEVLRLLALRNEMPVDERFTSVAFLCHGWLGGIQAGFLRNHVRLLAEAVKECVGGAEDVVVPLYCCSTGDDPQDDPITAPGTGDDSFADKLRDALCSVGLTRCRVVAHTTAAHATKNPMVLFLDGMGSTSGGVGGYPPVNPGSADWSHWKRSLQKTDLRLRMPYMTPAEIHGELSKPKKNKEKKR